MHDSDRSSSNSSCSDSDSEEENEKGAPRLSSVAVEGIGAEELLRIEEHELITSSGSEFRQFAFELVESRWFGFAILFVIFVNTVFIAIQTSEYVVAKAEWYLMFVDQIFLAVYIMELVLKLYVWRLRFFKQTWNVFDFVIVLASLVDFLIPLIVQNIGVFDARVFRVLRVFRAIRALRALRVLRTIRFLKNLQIIVSTVLQSIPALGSIAILISLVLYIFAIIGRGLYGHIDPDRYGNLAKASFTLFQLMTLDDWFYMYDDVRQRNPEHQHILIYLILFIILETFIFINYTVSSFQSSWILYYPVFFLLASLFVAVIVDNLARSQAAANATKPKKIPGLHKPKHTEHESDVDLAAADFRPHQRVTIVEAHIQRSADNYYSSEKYSARELELMGHYLGLLASLEHHLHTAQNHQRTLNNLVDLVDFSKT